MTRIQPPEPKASIQLEPHQILLRPLVTEKGVHRASRNNQYAFEIHRDATKHDVKKAVEQLFDVKVTKVRTLNEPKNRKRAYVTFSAETPAIDIATKLGLM